MWSGSRESISAMCVSLFGKDYNTTTTTITIINAATVVTTVVTVAFAIVISAAIL
ncbi:hypothetical protein FACS1894152_8650 [Bacilli bacterium]|nr:hypothetical protein FACS1894152_8650 [Bacilli bacterium]